MKCPKCQAENPDKRKFCREFGAKLISVCPQCGAENPPDDKLYKSRGVLTGRAPGMPRPTRKEVTANYLYLFHLKDGKIAEARYRGTTTGLNCAGVPGE